MKAKITLLPGDGIGPEIVDATRQVLETVARKSGHTFTFSTHLIGGIAWAFTDPGRWFTTGDS